MDSYDHDLALRIRNSDKRAFRELFEKYAPRIFRFALSYLKCSEDAEELVQNVFLKVWEKRFIVDSSQNIKGFLFTIAVNLIYDAIRHKKIEQTFHKYTKLQPGPEEETTWNSVALHETEKTVFCLLRRLPKQQQRIFSLSKIEGLSNDEIGIRMGISKRTVENNLYRAMSFLKQNIKSEIQVVFILLNLCF